MSWATTAGDNVTVLQMALRHQTATLVLDRHEALLHAAGRVRRVALNGGRSECALTRAGGALGEIRTLFHPVVTGLEPHLAG